MACGSLGSGPEGAAGTAGTSGDVAAPSTPDYAVPSEGASDPGTGPALAGSGNTERSREAPGLVTGGLGLDPIGGSGAVGAAPDAGAVRHQPSFSKLRLNGEFYSEGINYGDIDGDGAVDIIAGPYWYPGPGYVEKRAFREPRATPFDVSGDSDCYSIFVDDLNQDGWLDIVSFRLAGGAEAVWYENPRGAGGYWPEHVVYSAVDDESATFTDIDGDGKAELVTVSNGYGGWAQPDWTDAARPWTFRRVTERGPWARYWHGLGVSDVNRDGRADLILPEGWWEQPATPSTEPWVSHPVAFWGKELSGESYGGAQMFADDVDGDGDNDVVTSLQAHGWGLAWFEQTESGFVKHLVMNTRNEQAQYGVAFAQLHALELADLDGDGARDIVTGKRKGAHGIGLGAELDEPAVLYWFQLIREPGQPPRYEPHLIDSEAGIGTQVVVADLDGDGFLDILTAARAGAFLFSGH